MLTWLAMCVSTIYIPRLNSADAPCSSYSAFDTHMDLNVAKDARMDPPIQVLYNRSGDAAILIFMSLGDKECLRTSFSNRSPKPGNMVLPPESTIFAYIVLRKSVSHLMTHRTKQSCTPLTH